MDSPPLTPLVLKSVASSRPPTNRERKDVALALQEEADARRARPSPPPPLVADDADAAAIARTCCFKSGAVAPSAPTPTSETSAARRIKLSPAGEKRPSNAVNTLPGMYTVVGRGVCDTVPAGVVVGALVSVGELDGVPDSVGVLDGVWDEDGVCEGELDDDGVMDGELEEDGV